MNLLTILSNCNSVKGMFLMKDPKAFSLRIITWTYFFKATPKCHLHTNKELINLEYNDMKNLRYMLSCFKGIQSVVKGRQKGLIFVR